MDKVKVWANRGASGYAPENTLEAFEMAAKMKVDGVELDIQMARDGCLVVIHDETINRVSDGRGYVRDFTLKELKGFNFNKLHPEYRNAKMPTLREVYELLKDTPLTVNIELKMGFDDEGFEERVLDLTERMGMGNRVIYSSFNHYRVQKIRTLNPYAQTGVLYMDGIYNVSEYAQSLGANALHPMFKNLQYSGMIRQAKEKGLKLHVWTVDKKEEMEQCLKLGIDVVISNYPDKMLQIVNGWDGFNKRR